MGILLKNVIIIIYIITSQICSPAFSLLFFFSFIFFFPSHSHLYIFLTVGEKYFLFPLHFCLKFFFLILLFHLFFYLSLKKIGIHYTFTLYDVIVLYTIIMISIATKLNYFVFCFFIAKKKYRTDRPS